MDWISKVWKDHEVPSWTQPEQNQQEYFHSTFDQQKCFYPLFFIFPPHSIPSPEIRPPCQILNLSTFVDSPPSQKKGPSENSTPLKAADLGSSCSKPDVVFCVGGENHASCTKDRVNQTQESESFVVENAELMLRETPEAVVEKLGKKTPMWGKCVSKLNEAQQKRFLQLEQKARLRAPHVHLAPAEMFELFKLQQLVMPEQNEFRAILLMAAKKFWDHYFYIHPSILHHVSPLLEAKKMRASHLLNQSLFHLHQTLGLTSGPPSPADPVMLHRCTLLQLGVVPCCRIPPQVKYFVDPELWAVKISRPDILSIPVENELRPAAMDSKTVRFSWKISNQKKPTIAEDPFLESLLATNEVDVITSSSVLVCLIDNHAPNFDKDWEIPVKVVEKPHPYEVGKIVKHVFLEKPILKRKMTVRETTHLFYDQMMENILTNDSEISSTFSHIYFQPQNSTNPKNCPSKSASPPPSETTSDEEETQLAMLEDEDEEEGEKEKEEQKREEGEEGGKVGCEQVSCLLETRKHNFCYNLWKFGDLKVLVRSRIHGYVEETCVVEKDACNFQPMIKQRFVGIQTKLEYQYSSLGCLEEASVSDVSRWWMHTYLRPDAHLLLGHIDVTTSELICVEKKTMSNILSSAPAFRPSHSMKNLRMILEHIFSLSGGDYLVSHKKATPHIVFYRHEKSAASSRDAVVDMISGLSTRGSLDTDVDPYINLIPPRKYMGLVPFLFPPGSPPELPPSSRKRRAVSGKKSGSHLRGEKAFVDAKRDSVGDKKKKHAHRKRKKPKSLGAKDFSDKKAPHNRKSSLAAKKAPSRFSIDAEECSVGKTAFDDFDFEKQLSVVRNEIGSHSSPIKKDTLDP